MCGNCELVSIALYIKAADINGGCGFLYVNEYTCICISADMYKYDELCESYMHTEKHNIWSPHKSIVFINVDDHICTLIQTKCSFCILLMKYQDQLH